jgi:predicted ATP-dependent serine protease
MSSMSSAPSLPKLRRETVPSIQLVDNQWFSDSLGVFVQGASYLLGGAPGSRKSGLAAQLALDLARQGKTVLTIPTEEPEPRVWDRFYPTHRVPTGGRPNRGPWSSTRNGRIVANLLSSSNGQ